MIGFIFSIIVGLVIVTASILFGAQVLCWLEDLFRGNF